MMRTVKNYMPVCLDINRKDCLVVGGGNVASRKISALLKFGGLVTCLSPEFIKPLKRLGTLKKITCIQQRYGRKMSLKKYALVVAATNDPVVNTMVARHARRDKTLVNVVDSSAPGTITMPAILKRKNFVIGVSSRGLSPRDAKKMRDRLRHAL